MNEKQRDIGLKIKMARLQKGLTQYDLAEQIGVTNQDISAYEKGRIFRIPTEKFLKICHVLGIEPSCLDNERFNGEKETKNEMPNL